MNRMIKRSLSIAAALIFTVCMTVLAVPNTYRVSASEDRDFEGYWIKVGTRVYSFTDDSPLGHFDDMVPVGYSDVSAKNVVATDTSLSGSYLYYTGDTEGDENNPPKEFFEWGSGNYKWNAPPNRINLYTEGIIYKTEPEYYEVRYTSEIHNVIHGGHIDYTLIAPNYYWMGPGGKISICRRTCKKDFDFDSLNDERLIDDYFTGGTEAYVYGLLHYTPGEYRTEAELHAASGTEDAEHAYDSDSGSFNYDDLVLMKDSEDEYSIICIMSTLGRTVSYVLYIYEFHMAEEEDIPVPVVPDDTEEDNPITQDVVTVADNNPGEDAGTDIISEIIEGADDPGIAERIGTAGGGALTVGGVTALLKGKKKKKEKEEKKKEKKKSRYRMYVSKDFGDALQKGGKAVAVRARIDEIDDNGTRHPNQLFTQKIEVSGEEIIVESASLRGNWMEAMIRADAKSENDKGTLIFKFEGSGGTFRNHITFRLVDKPQLIFPEIKEDGTWVSNGKTPIAYLIAGAGGETSLPFMFLDAASEPEEIKFTTPSDIDITEKREENYTIGYYAVIANRTKEAEKENDVFAEMRTETVGLEAVFAGDVVVRGEFYIDIVPAGLSVLIRGGMNPLREGKPGVRDKLKEGFLEVISYATRQDDELTLDPLIRPTGFDLCYAYTDLKGNCHIETEAECFRFGKLMPTDEATNSILAKYEYEIGTTGGFSIEPQDSLPELEEKYYVKLPVSASAEGFFANADIPIRLLGEPYDPLQDWKTEYRELQLAILRYYPIEYAKQRLRYVRNELNDPEIYDKSWLRAMRKSIIEASQDYWLREVKYQEKLIMYYDISDTIFKKPPRFMADVALKIIFKYYYGENEGWISPLVGMCLDILDEALWDYVQTGEMNVDLHEKIMKFATDALENYISVSDDAGKLTNFDKSDPKLKQFIIFLTMWLIADLYKNYSGMNPKDFWESVRKTCVDLTGMAGKKYLGAKLQQVINSETMQKFLKQKWVQNITDYLKKNLAPEQAYIKGKGIDYGNNNLKFTRRFDQQMELVNGDKIERLGDLGDKPSLINFSKDGRRLDINNLDTLDIKNKMNTMLPDAKGNFQFSEMELDHMELLTYAGIIQTYIEEFFGLGIANITDSDKIDPKGQDFLNFDVELKVAEIGLDIAFRIEVNYLKLLTSVATGAFIPSCFEAIYDALIGWYPFKNTGSESLSNDVGREIHKMDKLPSA